MKYRFNGFIKFFFGFAFLVAWQNILAGPPVPAPLPMAEFLNAKRPLILAGRLERVVYISKDLAERLARRDSLINTDELRFVDFAGSAGLNGQFMEISRARILLTRDVMPRRNIDACIYKFIYIPVTIDFSIKDEIVAHYRRLIGQDVIGFVDGRIIYGHGNVRFPEPIFTKSFGENWEDGKVLPLTDWGKVESAAREVDYAAPSDAFCKIN